MLQRFVIQLAFIFLFAFTQIGVVTHEISHVVGAEKHGQQDKNTSAEQCEQCLSYVKVASGLPWSPFVIPEIVAETSAETTYQSDVQAFTLAAYAARAPPQITSI